MQAKDYNEAETNLGKRYDLLNVKGVHKELHKQFKGHKPE